MIGGDSCDAVATCQGAAGGEGAQRRMRRLLGAAGAIEGAAGVVPPPETSIAGGMRWRPPAGHDAITAYITRQDPGQADIPKPSAAARYLWTMWVVLSPPMDDSDNRAGAVIE